MALRVCLEEAEEPEAQMNCFLHDRSPAVGLCASCQKAVCRECVGRGAPRVICRACMQGPNIMGFEYRSTFISVDWGGQ